ncbi:putative synaptotagmin-2-like [Apostichopus japonicus]|uniref:Putative synaptotagmin-2-like n=1 Tax=Stichopus japonicus TaxID=307972 RepID=A0A2G8JMS4_STIJA|nr:putative synaptotagmin-2-like [Apostichopus japonicus]
MGSGSSSTAAPSGPRPQTSIPPINYKSDDANVNRLVQKLSRQSKRRKYPNSTIENSEDDFAERQARNQESVYILKQLYKRMDPAVMKTIGEAKGEVKLSFKYNEKRGALLVKVVCARDLSAKDLRGNTIDPYVKMELIPDSNHEGTKSTRFARKTLQPIFNEIFTFKVTPEELVESIFRAQVLSRDPMGKDDFLGERIIRFSEMNLAETWTSWFELQPETDLNIRGDLEVSLSYKLPDTLIVTVHAASDLLSRDVNRPPNPYVKVIVSGIPKGAETQIQRKTLSPVWEESFEYTLAKEELVDRYVVLHVLDKAMIGDTEVLGQVYIDLTNLDIYNGFRGKFELADLKTSDRVRSQGSQSTTAQEFKEAMYAHSVYTHTHT